MALKRLQWGFPTFALILALGVGVVVWSPLLMYRLLGDSPPWETLADVGQAYGGASALLSAVALCGIGASTLFQSRQTRLERLSLDRQRHFDLIRLALDNPEFLEVVDGDALKDADGRRKIFANLMLAYWLTTWELGVIDEPFLRSLTADVFKNSIAREWWGQVHERWIAARGRRGRQFIRIVDEEWVSAMATLRAPSQSVASINPRRHSDLAMWWCGGAQSPRLLLGLSSLAAGAGATDDRSGPEPRSSDHRRRRRSSVVRRIGRDLHGPWSREGESWRDSDPSRSPHTRMSKPSGCSCAIASVVNRALA